jgi:outer membrane protein assembly factor BamB
MKTPRVSLLIVFLGASLCSAVFPTSAQGLVSDIAATRWPASASAAPEPDDSSAAVEAAKARLRMAPRSQVCADMSRGSRRYGTNCASREFNAPPRLEAPRQRWSLEPGWRGLWSPYLIGDLLLTGSCFNETHQGLSAIDQRTGKVLWRNAKPCREGGRNGSVGITALYEWKPGQVLWVFNREDGKPVEYMIVDLRNGAIVGTVTPPRRGALRQRDGVFITVSNSKQDQAIYLNGLSPQLDEPLWRLEGFHRECDAFNRFCDGAVSTSAGSDGVEYISLMPKDQPDPPAKQLHAIDARTGRLLWRHQAQPVMLLGPGDIQRRSDDGTPMVADGRVIIRVDGMLGPVPVTSSPGSFAYRALHPKTGGILWTTEALPRHFKEPWAGTTSQKRGTHIAAGNMLITEVLSGDENTKELWAYRLTDGSLAWRRPVSRELRLMASAGGVIHVSISGNGGPTHSLQGLDSQTGTLLWSTEVVAHNNPVTGGWAIEGPVTHVFLGPFFRIALDGSIYGTTVTTAYRMD